MRAAEQPRSGAPAPSRRRSAERGASELSSFHRETSAGAFTAGRLPELEAALDHAVTACAPALPGIAPALERAVGIDGRAGRRWRPMLTLAAARACGVDPARVMPLAVAVELTHTASLVLDDLPCMDDSPERRGEPSSHRLVGQAGAILLAVGLLARSAELLGSSGCADSSGIVCSEWGRMFGFAGMAGGQALDLRATEPLKGDARRLHRRKTTVLAAFAVSSSARFAGASEATRMGLHRFGLDVGWAYQLADDAKDRLEDAAAGRPPGGRRPARQSAVLLRRGLKTLAATPGLLPSGVEILAELARDVVTGATPETNPSPGVVAC